MIDFPAAPTDGQIFSATNGVVYKYSVAYASWLAQNPAPAIGGTGDFFATYVGALAGPAPISGAPFQFNTVQSGNAGGWYNISTGRYTPPAGRYHIFGGITFQGTSPTTSTGSVLIQKSASTNIPVASMAITGSGFTGTVPVSGVFDANGTDFFTINTFQSVASQLMWNGTSGCWFGASPLTGLQGPTGPTGGLLINGTGAPSLSAAKGTLYINTTATTTTTRLYINTDGGTTWANFTASA